ncbi:hypothetical protein N7470_005774 [Penicillium chermesinum]|nr:hypothetical protein N7470_005774 [Penicillium chermesinum]
MLFRRPHIAGPRGRLTRRLVKTFLLTLSIVFLLGIPKTTIDRDTSITPFRENPDVEYERQLTKALKAIEERDQHGPPPHHVDTIWQVLLKDPERPQDAIEMEAANPEWEYKLATGPWAEEFVTKTLASVPGLADLYHAYPRFVQRGDLIRYLILWYYGGYYADVDVFPKRSIKSCPSAPQSLFSEENDVSLVLGIEIDEPYASEEEMKHWHWVRRYGFLQYTIHAPRRFSPLLREVIVRVLSHTKKHLATGGIFFGPKWTELAILEVTGPGVFTDAIMDVLSHTLPSSHPLVEQSVEADAGLGDLVPPGQSFPLQRVTWAPFYRLQETLCVNASEAKIGKERDFGGLCVLPINAWGNGQRHSQSEDYDSEQACINHRFGGSWKPWKVRRKWGDVILGVKPQPEKVLKV